MTKITLSDKIGIDAPVGRVSEFTTNFKDIASCIPAAKDFRQIDGKSFSVNVTISLAFINGEFEVTCTLVEKAKGHVAYTMEGSGVGSTMMIRLAIDMHPKGSRSTDVSWRSDTEIRGLASGVSESVLRKVSEGNIGRIISNVKTKLEKGSGGR